jgi:hypothetical protein
MSKLRYAFNDIVLTHEKQQYRHRLISEDGASPWLPIKELITYDIAGRSFMAIRHKRLPECFEILAASECVLDQDVTVGG